ncbi:unnamed protein product [Pipistrellus nathusii]|uniref:Uncharacterized protein n=1 Tax=Pipistrellus nathusii TaxID=59473 RepID=A0ABN9ZSE9_PIPNA
MNQPLYPAPASTHPVHSPCCTCVIIQELLIACEIGFKFLSWPLKLTLIWKYLHLCSFSCTHSTCLHLPNSSWSLGILLLLLPGMSLSPISASGNLLDSTEALLLQEALAGPVSTLYQISLPGAHLPRPVDSLPEGSALQWYQLRVSTPVSLLPCTQPCAGH